MTDIPSTKSATEWNGIEGRKTYTRHSSTTHSTLCKARRTSLGSAADGMEVKADDDVDLLLPGTRYHAGNSSNDIYT